MILIAQTDHPYILEWLGNARLNGGSFLACFSAAALVADEENYSLLKPVVDALRVKYPQYEPSDTVKLELQEEVALFEQRKRMFP